MSDLNVSSEAPDISGMTVEVMQVPVLSTAHISAATRDMLDSGNPQFVLHCARYSFGYFIAVPTEDFDDDMEAKPTEDLATLFTWARKHGFCWIRLDSDGSFTEELPTHDW